MPVVVLVQFSGTPNTEQYRICELLSLASNEEVLREEQTKNSSSSTALNAETNIRCTCCCKSSACSSTFHGNATSNNSNDYIENKIKIVGGCPTICSLHTLKRKEWAASQNEEDDEDETENQANADSPHSGRCCSSCHLPSFMAKSSENNNSSNNSNSNNHHKNWVRIFTRVFRAFITNNCPCVFVEFSSLALVAAIAKRSMMITSFWLVTGVGQDDQVPNPTIKSFSISSDSSKTLSDYFGPGAGCALEDSFNSNNNNNLHNNSSRMMSSLVSSTTDEDYNGFLTKFHYTAPTYTYRIEYASPAKYSSEVAKGFVEELLVKHPAHAYQPASSSSSSFENINTNNTNSKRPQRYNYRTPDTTYMMILVPPPGLKNVQNMQIDARKNTKDNDAAAGNSPSTTFYLHAVLFSTTPRCLLMNLYTVKLRRYIGTTTMVPELSFLLNNCGRVKRGDLVLDPFCGTGSLLMAARHLGAQTLGFDIDGRVMRRGTRDSAQTIQAAEFRFGEAKTRIPQILASDDAKKFLGQKQLDLLSTNLKKNNDDDDDASAAISTTMFEETLNQNPQGSFRQNFQDLNLGHGPNCFVGSFSAFSKSFGHCSSSTPSSRRPWLDAIVTDPPYGIRETKRKTEETFDNLSSGAASASILKNQNLPLDAHPLYEATELLVDLICFAADALVEGGRLVFWMSVTSYDYDDRQLPRHPSMRLISNIPQQLNAKMVRRLVVMEKSTARNSKDRVHPEVISRSDILQNTMKALELRKAVDLPVDAIFFENNNNNKDGQAEEEQEDADDDNDILNSTNDVNAQDVKKNIEKAQRKRVDRLRRNEAAAQWRRENMPEFVENYNNKVKTDQAEITNNNHNNNKTFRKQSLAKSKAELRNMNVENRAKNIGQQKQQQVPSQNEEDDDDNNNNDTRRRQQEGSQPQPQTPPQPK